MQCLRPKTRMPPQRRRPAGPRPSSAGHSPDTPRPPAGTSTATRRSVATWTVVSDGGPIAWASRSRWTAQPRPLRSDDPTRAPPPFRGLLLTDRHLNDPPLPLSEEERRLLCPVCRVPEIHRRTHRRGTLHRTRVQTASQPRYNDLSAALDTIRRLQPELLRDPPPAHPVPQVEDVLLDFADDEDL
ncbi:uncharacterized protein LOC135376713 [Ornithodoros turicata]|uniref:uncharacterized protein LOC135376713 n=1 Tax=Ornithodoros turicata TaxID=34597 RepID=UPI003139AE8D